MQISVYSVTKRKYKPTHRMGAFKHLKKKDEKLNFHIAFLFNLMFSTFLLKIILVKLETQSETLNESVETTGFEIKF